MAIAWLSVSQISYSRAKRAVTGRAVLHVITFPSMGGTPPTARYSLGRVLISQQKAAATECLESSPIQPSGEQVGKVQADP